MFECLRCGSCCRDLIIKELGCSMGLFLMPHETSLFPSEIVSPMWRLGSEIKNYQLNVNVCPHLTEDNQCKIYSKRPVICRAFPLTLHVNPLTHQIDYASIDSKCKACVGIVKGIPLPLGNIFPKEIIQANLILKVFGRAMFNVPEQKVWLYDVVKREWKEITAGVILSSKHLLRGDKEVCI